MVATSVLMLSGNALANPDEAAQRIAYVKEGAVWLQRQNETSDMAVVIAQNFDEVRTVRRIEAARDGSSLLIVGEIGGLWIAVGVSEPASRRYACSGELTLLADGGTLFCEHGDGTATVERMRQPWAIRTFANLGNWARMARFGHAILAGRGGELWKRGGGTHRVGMVPKRIAGGEPVRPLSFAPDGSRAVGHFRDQYGVSLYTLALNGAGARRRLAGADAIPHSWSWDSEWVAVREQGRACAVRAVGGEYRCWEGFVPQSIDGESNQFLMIRSMEPGQPGDLFVVDLSGAHKKEPSQIASNIQAAEWLPGSSAFSLGTEM